MTFCVSHQKQLGNDPNKLDVNDAIKDDATRSHETDSARRRSSTESTNLGEHEQKVYR